MTFEARVKSVLSGDTVVLSNLSNPSQERILSLAYVSAPRLRREGDEVGNCCTSNCSAMLLQRTHLASSLVTDPRNKKLIYLCVCVCVRVRHTDSTPENSSVSFWSAK